MLGQHGRGACLRRAPHARASPGDARARARSRRCDDFPTLTPQDTREIVYSILNDSQRKRFENDHQLDFAYAIPGVARFRVNVFFQRGSISAAFRLIPQEITSLEDLGPAGGARGLHPQAARLRPRHRPDRFGQVDHARLDGRHDQPRPQRAHPHDRGPDRVPAPPQALHRQPARDRLRRHGLRDRAAGRAARGPRRDPRRRDARPRDDLDRADRGRDRPPRVRDPAHAVDRADGRPDHRRLPAAPAAPGPDAALDRAAGDRHPAAARRRPTASARIVALRGPGPDAGDPQPDPRGQDPPDLLRDPDLRLDRDADDGRPPGPARPHGRDHPLARRAAGLGARGAQAAARRRGRRQRGRRGAACSPTTRRHRPRSRSRRRVGRAGDDDRGRSRDEHLRLPRRRPRRRPVAGRARGVEQGTGHRAAAPAWPDRPRRLREARGAEAREHLPALQERQHAQPRRSSRASSRP